MHSGINLRVNVLVCTWVQYSVGYVWFCHLGSKLYLPSSPLSPFPFPFFSSPPLSPFPSSQSSWGLGERSGRCPSAKRNSVYFRLKITFRHINIQKPRKTIKQQERSLHALIYYWAVTVVRCCKVWAPKPGCVHGARPLRSVSLRLEFKNTFTEKIGCRIGFSDKPATKNKCMLIGRNDLT